MGSIVENLVKKLTDRLEIERIFKVEMEFCGVSYTHMLIVIPQQVGLSAKVIQPVVELCMMESKHVTYEILIFGEWKSKLKTGSLYYTYLSLPQHQVFSSSNNSVRRLSEKEMSGVMSLFVEMKSQFQLKSQEFLQAAKEMEEKGNVLKAAYLHQQYIRQHVGTLQFFVLAKTNKSPALFTKIKSVMTHIPMLMAFFQEHELPVINVLDRAHAAVTKLHPITIENSAYQESRHLWMRFLEEIDLMYQRVIQQVKEHLSAREEHVAAEVKKEDTPSAGQTRKTAYSRLENFEGFPGLEAHKASVHQLLDRIQQDHAPEELLLLAYRSSGCMRQFFLNHTAQVRADHEEGIQLCFVAIKRKCGPIKHRAFTYKGAEALVLFFDRDKVLEALNSGNKSESRFHAMIGQYGQLVLKKETVIQPTYCEAEPEKSLSFLTPQKVYETAIDQLYDLDYVLSELLVQEKATQAFLLGNMLELGVRWVLKARLGYVPLELSLHQLILFSLIADPRIYEFIWGGHRLDPKTLRAALNYKQYLNGQPLGDLPENSYSQLGSFASAWRAFVTMLLNENAVKVEEEVK